MAVFSDFIPLAQESIDTIRARLDSDVNAGVDPNSNDFVDTTEGGFFFDMTQAVAVEMARLWDFAATEVPAVAFPAYAWGDYLDDHAEALGLTRKDAVQATGTVRFIGTNGAFVATGYEVATTVTDETDDPIVFQTTASGTISGGYVDLAVQAEIAGASGNVLLNTITVPVSPNAGVASVTNQLATTGGADVETDEQLRDRVLLDLSGSVGGGTISDYQRWALAYPSIGNVTVTPIWNGPGTVHVVVTDTQQHAVSDAIKFGLQDELDPPKYVSATAASVTLPQGTINVTSTISAATSGTFILYNQTVTYTGVITSALSAPSAPGATPGGGGSLATNNYYYKVTALNASGETQGSAETGPVAVTGPTGSVALTWSAVTGATSYRIYRGTTAGGESTYYTSATNTLTDTGAAGTAAAPPGANSTSPAFTGCTGGTGTFAAGTRVAQGFGNGTGLAPIGAAVTVDTVAPQTINVSATVTHAAGYTLDGTGGTIATRTDLQTQINSYINSLAPGTGVVLNHVIARFFRVPGVTDVSGVLLNGSAANVAISALQVAQPGTITLS